MEEENKLKKIQRKIAEKYRYNFCFAEKDGERIAQKQNKALLVIMVILFLVYSAVFILDYFMIPHPLLEGFCISEKLMAFHYYYIRFGCVLFTIFLILVLNKKKVKPEIKSIPVYFSCFAFTFLNGFYYWTQLSSSGQFSESVISLAVLLLVFCVLFELNPNIMNVLLIFIIPVYSLSKIGPIEEIDIIILSVAFTVLAWWKRQYSVATLRIRNQLAEEKKKNDALLLNILPREIVEELKEKGKVEPEKFENVTVMFTDFKSFTSTTKDLPPEFVISELNDIFTNFDIIAESYGCTRIKTIGDSYFAVCGLPVKDPEHAEKIVMCANALVEYLKKRDETSKIKWQMRVGVHSGSVTAGIVGTKKYLYDIFGDTVNTASRMESNGEPMRVNISETTKKLLEGEFVFEKRDPVEVKGKGLMTMYFVDYDSLPTTR